MCRFLASIRLSRWQATWHKERERRSGNSSFWDIPLIKRGRLAERGLVTKLNIDKKKTKKSIFLVLNVSKLFSICLAEEKTGWTFSPQECKANNQVKVIRVFLMEISMTIDYISLFSRALTLMKARLKGAQKGHSLLKKKSDALTMRFRKILKQIIEVSVESGR